MSKILVKKPTEEELKQKDVTSWGIWTCEPSTFDWHYDSTEHCYVLEGDIVVKTDEGDTVIGPGDYAVFPKGLSCVWQVNKAVRKHYRFE